MKPIYITNSIKERLIDDFKKYLERNPRVDSKVVFQEALKYDNKNAEKVKLIFSQKAWTKQRMLIDKFKGEVGWHGFVTRLSPTQFRIEDIVVYPQTVTGATVTRDDKEYDEWLWTIDNDNFKKMRYQAHSHVNFGVSPSGTDKEHQSNYLELIDDEDFYIFAIINKNDDRYAQIYDKGSNRVYETEDIEFVIEGMEDEWFEESKNLVKEKSVIVDTKKVSGTVGEFKAKAKAPAKKGPRLDDDYIFPGQSSIWDDLSEDLWM